MEQWLSPYTDNGFTGESYGDSTQLIYLRSRYYNPADGRFTSRDTWSGDANRPVTMNRWNYVHSNPIMFIDPTGNIAEDHDEAKKAFEIVTLLRAKYNTTIAIDWGYYSYDTGTLTSVFPRLNPTNDPYVFNYGQCWHEGGWSIKDLEAIKAGFEIMSSGVQTLGGHFNSLTGHVTIVPDRFQIEDHRSFTIPGIITWQVKDTSSLTYRLYVVTHEMGHIVAFHDNRKMDYFMDELGASCSNQPWYRVGYYCNMEQQHGITYDPGEFAGDETDKLRYLPSLYAATGSYEDFAETWREVVLKGYLSSANNTWFNDAKRAYDYDSYSHDIGKRRTVMTSIINGSWK